MFGRVCGPAPGSWGCVEARLGVRRPLWGGPYSFGIAWRCVVVSRTKLCWETSGPWQHRSRLLANRGDGADVSLPGHLAEVRLAVVLWVLRMGY